LIFGFSGEYLEIFRKEFGEDKGGGK